MKKMMALSVNDERPWSTGYHEVGKKKPVFFLFCSQLLLEIEIAQTAGRRDSQMTQKLYKTFRCMKLRYVQDSHGSF